MYHRPFRSSLFFLLLLAAFAGSAQTTRSVLLNHVDSLLMPPGPEQTTAFLTVDHQPDIIAMLEATYTDNLPFRCGVILTAVLGKGKVLALGAPAYFKAEMLQDKNIAELAKNILHWARPKGGTPLIALAGSPDPGFEEFLKQQGAKFYTANNIELKKGTGILVLNRDVTDIKQLKQVEDFVSNGGTLIFISPYSDYNNGADAAKRSGQLDLTINKLLSKAGFVGVNIATVRTPQYHKLLADKVPDHLYIQKMLSALQNGVAFNQGETLLNNSAIDQAVTYDDPNGPVIQQIKKSLNIPAILPVPSRAVPVINNTSALKAAAKAGYKLYAKQQDFDHHPTAKANGYKIFPGDVPDDAVRVTETVNIPVMVGKQGLPDMPSVYFRPHSTGLYVPAGEKVTITIDPNDIKQQLRAQIGVHDDDVTHLDQFHRVPLDLTGTFRLDVKETDVYSPYGGLLMINIADTSTLKNISITVKGAVKAPYFRLGETSEQDWINIIRINPAPWAELATNKIVFTVPSYRIRALSNPVKLLQFWDEVMDADADLAVISRERVHQERLIVDVDAAYGSAFTFPNKIVLPDDEGCAQMLDEAFMRSTGLWGQFHELGHRHQFFDLDMPGTMEVTVNLFTMYVFDKVLHKGIYQHEGMTTKEDVIKKIKDYLANDPSYEKWSADPFMALSMYIQLIDAFGWEAIIKANTVYRNLPKDKYPNTDQDKQDLWFTTISKATNSNLTRFFEVWKVPVSDDAKKRVVGYKVWFPKELE